MPRAWKPNLLVPVEDPRRLRGSYELLWNLRDAPGSSCLFTRDSGEESALA